MPPTPSSGFEEKQTSEETLEPSGDRERERMIEKALVEELLASQLLEAVGISDQRRAAIAQSLKEDEEKEEEDTTNSDISPCNWCSRPFFGTMRCSRCEAAVYCSRDCQASHWSAGHKAECKQIKKQNEKIAKLVLDGYEEFTAWDILDAAGAYNAAVRRGLYDKIRVMLEKDKAEMVGLLKRDQGGCISFTQCVMLVLFKGGGRAADANNNMCSCVNGSRVLGYVTSHPGALDAWLQNSVHLVRAVINHANLRGSLCHREAHDFARDVWTGWAMALANDTAARAILEPFPGTGDERVGGSVTQMSKRREDHVRGIVKTLREAVRLVGSVSDSQLVEVYRVAAMVIVRAQEYRVTIDVEGMLNLNHDQKTIFQHIQIPMAKRTVEKGAMLNELEHGAVMARAGRALGFY